MTRLIRKYLKKLIRWAERYHETSEYDSVESVVVSNNGGIRANGMNFSLYKANGGYIVEYRVYDEVNDKNDNKLHIITNDEQMSERIGQIITLELLRS